MAARSDLVKYKTARRLTWAQIAETLTALTGERVSVSQARQASRGDGELREDWAAALGLSTLSGQPDDLAEPSDGLFGPGLDPDAAGAARASEQPPRPPSAEKVQQAPLPVSLSALAEERIARAYGLIGYGASVGTGVPGIAKVTDDCAPNIARAWVRAADQSEFARRVVEFATSGGATGELVLVHAFWIAGILYVSAAIPNVGGLFDKYTRHRLAPVETSGQAPSPAADGRVDAGAAGAVDGVASEVAA